VIRLLTDPGRRSPGGFAAWGVSAVRAHSHAPYSRASEDRDETPLGVASAEIDFSCSSLRAVRQVVAREAELAGLGTGRREDLILAVDELATNSVTHGGGHGSLSVWRTQTAIVCEVRDQGHISDPLAGFHQPHHDRLTGRGLWVVGCLCDCVQIASSPGRTAVRVRISTSA
jgi:anti-sigma regulatory factor (Ser/Thr protein kinase)